MMESYDSITFAAALAKLGMSKDASSGLRFVSRRFEENDVDIYWALEQANGFGATAVYFRFYNDKRPPKPQIYIYDNSDITPEKNQGKKVEGCFVAGMPFLIDFPEVLLAQLSSFSGSSLPVLLPRLE